MTTKYILPHFGLGDAIIINGLVRHFCQIYDNVFLFSVDCYFNSVKHMFRDLNNLEVLNFGEMGSVVQNCINYINQNNLYSDLIKAGYEELYYESTVKNPGALYYNSLYTMFDLDCKLKYDNFFYLRDEEYENYVFNYLNPNNDEYIFIIDDSIHQYGSFIIDNKKLPKNYKIIRYNKELNHNDDRFLMFNYGKILENAREIHSIETAFLEFIKHMKFSTPVYVHSYLKSYERPEVLEDHHKHLVNIHNFNLIL